MKKALLISAMAAVITGTTAAAEPAYNGVYWPAERVAANVLLNANYHDIQILYLQTENCKDGVPTNNAAGFRAISPQNHIVTGVVCDGQIDLKTTTVTEPKTA